MKLLTRIVWILVAYAGPLLAVSENLSIGAIVNPVGAYVRYDRKWELTPAVFVGGFVNYLVVSAETGASFSYQTDPKWLVFSVDLAGEPGFFIRANQTKRTFGARAIVRGQSTINLQFNRLRLYSRSTAYYRYRGFLENDAFQGIEIREETAIEQATALMVVMDSQKKKKWWLYGEYTVGKLFQLDTRPNRLSVGAITEDYWGEGLTLNLDVFYSFAASPIDGLGAFFGVWIAL